MKRFFWVILTIAASLALSGCCNTPAVRPVQTLAVRGRGFDLRGGSESVWRAPYDRLIDDIPRAVKRSHWGLISIEPKKIDAARTGGVIVAKALLANDRQATIVARPAGGDKIAVAIQVGLFGDEAAQQEFLTTLAETLAGDPKPVRQWKYELPGDF